MRKALLFIVMTASFLLTKVEAQVGIHTPNPQGSFNIDAAKDNPASGAPSAAQQVNDVTITSTGNIGMGTILPAIKLDIVGTTFGMKNSIASGSWDNIWFNVTPSIPSINVSGAESGLQFNVGANSSGTYGDGQTLTTVATMLATGNMGIGTTTPTNTLDVNGTTRIRTINVAPGSTVVNPVFTDANGVILKTSSTTYGGTNYATATVAGGATGSLITGLADGGLYKAIVIVGDGCAYVTTAEFYVTCSSFNSNFAIKGIDGIFSNGSAKEPTFTETNRTTTGVTWAGKPGCADGGNTVSLNYTLVMPSATAINVTNLGNISRSYKIILTRLN